MSPNGNSGGQQRRAAAPTSSLAIARASGAFGLRAADELDEACRAAEQAGQAFVQALERVKGTQAAAAAAAALALDESQPSSSSTTSNTGALQLRHEATAGRSGRRRKRQQLLPVDAASCDAPLTGHTVPSLAEDRAIAATAQVAAVAEMVGAWHTDWQQNNKQLVRTVASAVDSLRSGGDGMVALSAARQRYNERHSPLLSVFSRAGGLGCVLRAAVFQHLSLLSLWQIRPVCHLFQQWSIEALVMLPQPVVVAGALVHPDPLAMDPDRLAASRATSRVWSLDWSSLRWYRYKGDDGEESDVSADEKSEASSGSDEDDETAEPTEEGCECEYDCGFDGLYDVVAAHEQSCASRPPGSYFHADHAPYSEHQPGISTAAAQEIHEGAPAWCGKSGAHLHYGEWWHRTAATVREFIIVHEEYDSTVPWLDLSSAEHSQLSPDTRSGYVLIRSAAEFKAMAAHDPTLRLYSHGHTLDSHGSDSGTVRRFPRPTVRAACCRRPAGQLLVCGGETSWKSRDHHGQDKWSQNSTSAVFEWAPAAPKWRSLPAMLVARSAACAVSLTDGRVVVLGGFSDCFDAEYDHQDTAYTDDDDETDPRMVAMDTVEILSADNQAWSAAPRMRKGRANAVAGLLPHGSIIVAGGQSRESINGKMATVLCCCAEIWNPETGEWADLPSMEHHRTGAAGAMLSSGRFAVVGGLGCCRHGSGNALSESGNVKYTGTGGKYGSGERREDSEFFDHATNTWAPLTALPRARTHGSRRPRSGSGAEETSARISRRLRGVDVDTEGDEQRLHEAEDARYERNTQRLLGMEQAGRWMGTATAVRGGLLVVGGSQNNHWHRDESWAQLFDEETGRWLRLGRKDTSPWRCKMSIVDGPDRERVTGYELIAPCVANI